MSTDHLNRRILLRNASLAAAATVAMPNLANAAAELKCMVTKGRIKQSASKWCYRRIPLEELCVAGAKLGLKGIDLLGPDAFPTLKKYGLVCTMSSGGGALNTVFPM